MSSINLEIEEEERKKITDTLNSEIHGTAPITLPTPHSILGIPAACSEEGLDTTNAW